MMKNECANAGHDIKLFWQGYHRAKKAALNENLSQPDKETIRTNMREIMAVLDKTASLIERRELKTEQDAVYLGILEMCFSLAIPPRLTIEKVGDERDRKTDIETFRELLEKITKKLS